MSHLGGTLYIRANGRRRKETEAEELEKKGEGWMGEKREKYSRGVCARERHEQPKLNEPTRDPNAC